MGKPWNLMCPVSTHSVIVLSRWRSGAGAFSRIFRSGGFPVHVHRGPLAELDVTGVGALVVLARFRDSLVDVRRHAAPLAPDEEWILIEAGGDDACHCVVQLAGMASPPLRRFVRTLWARCSVT